MTPLTPPTAPPVGAIWPPPDASSAPSLHDDRDGDKAHATLPLVAAVGAIAVLVASLVGSKYLLDYLVRFEWPVVAYVIVLGVIGYGPSVLWCRHVSQRWGSGRFLTDVGLTPRWSDLGWGPVVWLTAIGMQIVVGAILLAFDVPLGNNTDGLSELSADRTYLISIVITAVVAAPIVEEIVFRGVVMRGLRSVCPAVVAVALQAILFGAAHIDPVRGVGNVGLFVVLTGVGAAFGGGAYLLRRIGPTIVAHAIFNGVVLLIVLTGIADRVQT